MKTDKLSRGLSKHLTLQHNIICIVYVQKLHNWHWKINQLINILFFKILKWVWSLGHTWWEQWTDSQKLSSDLHIYMCVYTCTHIYTMHVYCVYAYIYVCIYIVCKISNQLYNLCINIFLKEPHNQARKI